MKKFISKRNNVYFKDGMVFKELQSKEAAEQEAEFLCLLKSKAVMVPDVISVIGNLLCLEYIGGDTLPEFMAEQNNITRCDAVAENIAEWFVSFYNAVDHNTTSEIRGDVNGRNFLVINGKIVGIDFEEHIFGKKETDLGRILAYIATYNYEDSSIQKKMEENLFYSFVRNFSISEEVLNAEKQKELSMINKRRKQI